jgi:lipopolysaccharide transport system permease protein
MKQAEIAFTQKRQPILKELSGYHELIYFFVWRYFKVRYKQTAIGILWVIIQPLFLTAIVSLFILRGLKIDFGYENYVMVIIPIYAGIMLWSYFDKTVNMVGDSLITNRNIMTKVYFPKIIPPLAATVSGLIDMLFALIVFTGLVIFSGTDAQAVGLLLGALSLVIAVVATFGIGIFFAALNVEYRDISQVLPFLLRIGVFATPVFYPVTLLPDNIQPFAYLNPMTGVIELFRNGFFNPSAIDWQGVGISAAVAVVMTVLGVWIFRKKEATMIDVM